MCVCVSERLRRKRSGEKDDNEEEGGGRRRRRRKVYSKLTQRTRRTPSVTSLPRRRRGDY